MRIDDFETLAAISIVSAASVGGLGAYIIKPILNSMSPLGVALTCGVTTAIAFTILFCDMDVTGKFIGLMTAYPIGLMTSNLLKFNVRFLDPMVAVIIGGIVITPMTLTALCLSATFAN